MGKDIVMVGMKGTISNTGKLRVSLRSVYSSHYNEPVLLYLITPAVSDTQPSMYRHFENGLVDCMYGMQCHARLVLSV
jgi:hypothetical protein